MKAWLPLIGFCLSIFTGCGGGPISVKPPIVQPPLVEPVPVSVSVYYSEDLRNHKCTVEKGYIAESWTFVMGPPSIQMFDTIFTGLFRDVETLDIAPETATPRDQRDVIELRLIEFSGCEASWPIIGTTEIDIEYRAILRSAAGETLARLEGRGHAVPRDDDPRLASSRWSVPEATHLAILTSAAMRRAAADFMINFENDPAVRAWLRNRGYAQ